MMNNEQSQLLFEKVRRRFAVPPVKVQLTVEVMPTTEGTYVVTLSYSDTDTFVCVVFSSDNDFEALTALAFAGVSSIPPESLEIHWEEYVRDYRRLLLYAAGDFERARGIEKR